jgi:hypothetical protein
MKPVRRRVVIGQIGRLRIPNGARKIESSFAG